MVTVVPAAPWPWELEPSQSSCCHVLLVRGVKKEDKTLAVGMQFMLLRVLGKEPAWAPL
jgi:hypothetical protein